MSTLTIAEADVPIVTRRNEARVCDLLHWSAEKYAAFIFNSGLQYLQSFCNDGDDEAIRLISNHAPFWDWWRRLWFARDCSFVDECDGLEDALTTKTLRVIYRDLHNVEVLVAEICPPRLIYPPSFTIVTKKL